MRCACLREALRALTAWTRDLHDPHLHIPGLRWSKPEAMHVTLRFVGEQEPRRLKELANALQELPDCALPARLSPGRVHCFGKPERGRVLVVDVVDGRGVLGELEHRLSAALSALGLPEERRSFKPHVTLARMKPSRVTGPSSYA